jgi:hypothetical protein
MGYRFYIAKVKKEDLEKIKGKTVDEITKMTEDDDHMWNYTCLSEAIGCKVLEQVSDCVLQTKFDNSETIKYFGDELTNHLQEGYDFKVMSKQNIVDYNLTLNKKRIDWLEECIKDNSKIQGTIASTKMMLEPFNGEIMPHCPDDWSNAIYESYEIYKDFMRNKDNYIYVMYAW